MDLRKLKKLIDLVEASGIAELEITEGEEKVRIAKSIAGAPMMMVDHVFHEDLTPEKIDAVLDALLAQDPDGRVACEVLLTPGRVTVAGEISASGPCLSSPAG